MGCLSIGLGVESFRGFCFYFYCVCYAKSSTFCAARFFGPVPPAMSAAAAVCGKVYFH